MPCDSFHVYLCTVTLTCALVIGPRAVIGEHADEEIRVEDLYSPAYTRRLFWPYNSPGSPHNEQITFDDHEFCFRHCLNFELDTELNVVSDPPPCWQDDLCRGKKQLNCEEGCLLRRLGLSSSTCHQFCDVSSCKVLWVSMFSTI